MLKDNDELQIVTKLMERSEKKMQMCGDCMKVYDESEYSK